MRRLLNLGHTVGHALESLTHYALPHGEAVAIGLLIESHLAMQLGHLKKSHLIESKKFWLNMTSFAHSFPISFRKASRCHDLG